jgi:hypothetical protein
MNEKTLAFIWQNRLFDPAGLTTTQGEPVQVVKTGYANTMSGPDITDAQIRIGNLLWTGNVEFHTKSSNWTRHRHHLDRAYDNIILHVVFEDDSPLSDHQGNTVPTLVIKYDPAIDTRCHQLLSQQNPHLCPAGILDLSTFSSLTFTSRLTIERLQQKSDLILAALHSTQGDWMQTFWQYLARSFGFGKNLAHNIALLQNLDKLSSSHGLPHLVGVSRKRMIGEMTGRKIPSERVSGSVAAALFAVERGAKIVRVHDVRETVDALKVWQKLNMQVA